MRRSRFTTSTLVLLLSGLILPIGARAERQVAPKPGETASPRRQTAHPADKRQADKRQAEIRQRFRKFERALLVMAEYLAKTDKTKAQLIRDALQKSRKDRIEVRMSKITRLLKSGQFGDAVEAQDQLLTHLNGLLNLLRREERHRIIRDERIRLEGIEKDLEKLGNQQKRERFNNERGVGDPQSRAKAQADIEKQTRDLRNRIDRHDAGGNGKTGGQPGGKPSGKPHNHNQKTPGRDEIEQARRAMDRAVQELKKARRAGAADEQAKAERKIHDALDKLKEILKQLREEERELLLRNLEARFRRMLQMQKRVYSQTRVLDRTPKSAWTARETERVRELAGQEQKIAVEAQKALVLLKADGSSIAFPEVVKEARADMLTVERLLSKQDVGKDTQAIERDIIDALSESIEALKKEIESIEKEDGEGPRAKDPPRRKPRDPSLVEKVAELKMLRSLQMRVNRRTRRLGQQIPGDQATEQNAEVVRQLKELAKRQARIQKSAYDLATQRNR